MMRKSGYLKAAVVLALCALFLAGCGDKADKDKEAASKNEFRIPDSLLSPLDGYKLVRDEYHPVRGGVMASKDIEVRYPAAPVARYIAVKIFGYALEAYRKVDETVGRPADGSIVLIGATDLDEYKLVTRKEWWYYGLVKGDTIYFEPFNIMIKRTIAEMGLTQKIAQAALARRSKGRIPMWLKESLASYIAGEYEILEMQAEQFRHENANLDPSPADIEEALEKAEDFRNTRIAFFAAYRMLENFLNRFSFETIFEFIDELGAGRTLDEAAEKVFGMDYGSVIDAIRVDRPGESK